MALGLPCITSPVSGNPELISKDYLIEYEDIMGMANMVEKLLTNKRLYEEASRNNYEKSIEYNSEVLNSRRTIFYKNIKNKIKVVNN